MIRIWKPIWIGQIVSIQICLDDAFAGEFEIQTHQKMHHKNGGDFGNELRPDSYDMLWTYINYQNHHK